MGERGLWAPGGTVRTWHLVTYRSGAPYCDYRIALSTAEALTRPPSGERVCKRCLRHVPGSVPPHEVFL
jgi:hypothetical protein